MSMSRSAEDALKNFLAENKVKTIDERDAIYQYDHERNQQILNQQPWTKNVNYFKKVKISAVALVKMVMHARSGGNIEVMGLMQGKVIDDTMVVMDTYALPVEGTETRVNAQQQGNEYMIEYLRLVQQVGRKENPIGWYHSHPGYGCWLSGIDVSTQMTNQQYQEPFLAVVVDPTRTISAGKVEIGAFRTYPQGHKVADDGPQEYQTIPLSKIEDFGVHCKQYYPLEISYFKSSSDSQILSLLWNKYWVSTLSSNPLLANREFLANQIADLSDKLEQAEQQVSSVGTISSLLHSPSKKEETQLSKASKDSSKLSVETTCGLVSQVVKNVLFNQGGNFVQM